jgi:uncharacterized protein YbjT (DUF2867 family)
MVETPSRFIKSDGLEVDCHRGCSGIESAEQALKDVDTAYYLIPAPGTDKEFAAADIEAAIHFRLAAEENQIKRIIYLGLGDTQTKLSPPAEPDPGR